MIYCMQDSYYDVLALRGMNCSDIEEIYTSLSNQDYRIRTYAAQVIQTKYPTKKSFDKAIKLLSSKKYYEREIGSYVLGQLGTPNMPFAKESMPFLYKLLDDKSISVKSSAISSIGHLWSLSDVEKDEQIVDKIINFTNDRHISIQISSIMALSSLIGNKKAMRAIKKILNNSKIQEVKEWAEVAMDILS